MDFEYYIAVLGGFVMAIGGVVQAFRLTAKFDAARRWQSTKGRILESAITKEERGTHFKVTYFFEAGQPILGKTPRLAGDWFWSNSQQAAFVKRFTPGQEVEVYYDPDNPERNCLDRTDRSGIGVAWGFAFLGAICSCLLVLLKMFPS